MDRALATAGVRDFGTFAGDEHQGLEVQLALLLLREADLEADAAGFGLICERQFACPGDQQLRWKPLYPNI